MKLTIKSDIYPRTILIFSAGIIWFLVWLYSYYNPILNIKSILCLTIVPIYLFIELLNIILEKKRLITKWFLIAIHIFMIISTWTIDENTFRNKLIVRKFINSDISDIQRFIEFRENDEFNDYILLNFPFSINIFGIKFRETYGEGKYDYHQCKLINLKYKHLDSVFDTTGLKIQTLPSYYLDKVNCN